MSMAAALGRAIQQTFGDAVDRAALASQVVRRQRKLTAAGLAKIFLLGFLSKPAASDEDLARMAAEVGEPVSPQAIEQRHTPRLAAFLRAIFEHLAVLALGSPRSMAPLLERFTKVVLIDGSTIKLPDGVAAEHPGCGGSHDSGKAALKLQTEFDLRSGALRVQVEPGRSPDAATDRQQARHGPGSLRIADLGYFCLGVFAAMQAANEYFLSRLQFGTSVEPRSEHGERGEHGEGGRGEGRRGSGLLAWLARQGAALVDCGVALGREERLGCRLLAWRLPQAQADRRRRLLRAATLKKKSREPSAERLAWCDWTILVTNVPPKLLSGQEALVLYRARWQVELLFKRWKSQNLVATLSGASETRQMVRVWARLAMSVLQHLLVTASVWGDPTKSLGKACGAVRVFAGRLAASLGDPAALEAVLAAIAAVLARTCRRDPRRRPGTFELLNHPHHLDFQLS